MIPDAKYYRDQVLPYVPLVGHMELSLEDCLKSLYQELKSSEDRLTNETRKNVFSRTFLYVTSIGLFALGHLDVCEDIFAYLPLPNYPYKFTSGVDDEYGFSKMKRFYLISRKLIQALVDLTPMPRAIFDKDNIEPAKIWLADNARNLIWNAEFEMYEFKSKE